MHPDIPAEFHEIRHRGGHIVTADRYRGAWCRIRIPHPAVEIDDETEASRAVVKVLADNLEVAYRSSPPIFARSNRRDDSHSAVLDQIGCLLGEIYNHPSLLRGHPSTQAECEQGDRYSYRVFHTDLFCL